MRHRKGGVDICVPVWYNGLEMSPKPKRMNELAGFTRKQKRAYFVGMLKNRTE